MGALGTELSSEALTLRVFRVSKNRERQYINVWYMAHLDVSLHAYWNSHISVCKFANLQNPNLQICKFGRQFANLDASLQTLGALVFKYLRGGQNAPRRGALLRPRRSPGADHSEACPSSLAP